MSSDSSPFVEKWLDGALGTKFYTRLYSPPPTTHTRAVLVFVHGYIEHIGRYTAIHTAWAANGVAVFTYDMRGFGHTALGDGRSETSMYGKTGGGTERMLDVEWAIQHAHKLFPQLPLFLMGHSMGGGLVLSFTTRTESPPQEETISLLSGVIASSPLVKVARRAPSALEFTVLGFVSRFLPNLVVKTPVQDQDLSHDPNVGPDSLKDPWIKGFGRLQGLVDMIRRGGELLSGGYKHWPAKVPLLILHGTIDMVNAYEPAKEFFALLQAPDKEFIAYEDMMHDLMTEPGLKDRYFPDCLRWVEKRLSAA